VTNRPYVAVRLRPLKLHLRHAFVPSSSIQNKNIRTVF
jgi:hypothetical protein